MIIIRRRDAHSMRSATVPESAEPDPICPVCHHGRLTTMHEEWFVLPSAGYPKTSDEGTVERGLPIGVRSCPVCEHVALFLPPTLDASGQPYRRGRSPHTAARTEPQAAASGDPVTPEINAALMIAAERAITREDGELLEAVEAAFHSIRLELQWNRDEATGKMWIGTTRAPDHP
jgi:hypothetical protein